MLNIPILFLHIHPLPICRRHHSIPLLAVHHHPMPYHPLFWAVSFEPQKYIVFWRTTSWPRTLGAIRRLKWMGYWSKNIVQMQTASSFCSSTTDYKHPSKPRSTPIGISHRYWPSASRIADLRERMVNNKITKNTAYFLLKSLKKPTLSNQSKIWRFCITKKSDQMSVCKTDWNSTS